MLKLAGRNFQGILFLYMNQFDDEKTEEQVEQEYLKENGDQT